MSSNLTILKMTIYFKDACRYCIPELVDNAILNANVWRSPAKLAGDVVPASTPLCYFLSHSAGFGLIVIIIIIIFNINKAGKIEYFPIVLAQLFKILVDFPAQLTLCGASTRQN